MKGIGEKAIDVAAAIKLFSSTPTLALLFFNILR
jgi:hypothetical protein